MLDEFSRHRRKLVGLAYRMLGSAAEAEDVVHDAWLRWNDNAADVVTPEAWLTTTVTRLCLDRLKSARAKRETYVGPWLPEPVVTTEDEVDADSVSMAFLLLLERLSPVERAAYLLHAVFDNDHGEVAKMLGRSEASVRQAFHRAKEHLTAEKPRYAPSKERHAELLAAFVKACKDADVDAIRAVLARDAKATTDGGGVAKAALREVAGADAVARFFVGLVKKYAMTEVFSMALTEVNGWPGALFYEDGKLMQVMTIETDGEAIHAVRIVLNPEKLRAMQA